jgi:hypothetical protein
MPSVEKKDLLEAQTAGLPVLGSECSSSAGTGSGLSRRGHTEGGRVFLVPEYQELEVPENLQAGKQAGEFCKQS